MGGGLIQLVSYGAQDAYLSGNPQMREYQLIWRRGSGKQVGMSWYQHCWGLVYTQARSQMANCMGALTGKQRKLKGKIW